ncbi:MAG: SDR family oxidoreductase [Alphaproteobacteria bacterium]|jgi:NAD(P)-dependent dehydrogenase (short-subunit alcohol dehydrogenase family)|nr:SDR family oxidoreductase [Alphaproteobacteria bacterium]
MDLGMRGACAVVTGAAGGIGRASALAFSAEGASVVVSDINEQGARETAALITDAGGRAVAQTCDVAKAAEIDALMQRALSEFGRLDFAHNNAGINSPRADEWDQEVFERSLAVNLTSVMLCMKAEAQIMLAAGGGAIVNTASINGLVGNPAQPGYVSSKHGVVGLTRSAALKWARQSIRVNCVCPGVIDTAMVASVVANPQYRAAIEQMTPMGRMGTAEEVAHAVVWLCSPRASFVTGHAMVIDGGATAI